MKSKYLVGISLLSLAILLCASVSVQAETFGKTTHANEGVTNIERRFTGTPYYMNSENGIADNMSVYLQSSSSTIIRLGIYEGALSSLTLVGQTDCVTCSGGGWKIFDFSSNVNLVADTLYTLTIIGASTSSGVVHYGYSGGNGVRLYVWSAFSSCINLKSPLALSSGWSAPNGLEIFCTYTPSVSNNAPTQANHTVWDGTTEKNLNATEVAIPPTCFNVTVNDIDSDLINVSVFNNKSGTWKLLNQTASGMSNGTFHAYNTSFVTDYSTKYYLAFNVSDNDDYVNETYEFTSLTNNAPVQSNHILWCESSNDEFLFNASDISKYITSINVTVNDSDGDYMNITTRTNVSDTWQIINQTSSGMLNGTFVSYNTSWIANYSTTYFVSFNLTDGKTWVNETYNFTTKASPDGGCGCDEIQAMLNELKNDILDELEGDEIIELEINQWSMLLAVGIFVFLFAVGYNSEKRSGGLFLLIAGFTLFYIEALATLNGWLSPVFVLPFLSPLAIYIVVIGAKKFAYGANLKTDSKQK